MKVQVTDSGTWRRTLEIEAPADDVDKRLNAAYRKYSKSLNIPGFRKGKVPLRIVKKQYGPAIQSEVIQELVEECYQNASQSEGIRAVSRASIDDVTFSEGQPLVFKASVDVRPEIVVEHYKGLKVKRPVYTVAEDHIEGQLRRIQEQNAHEKIVDRPAGIGDLLLAAVEELDGQGHPKPDSRREEERVILGKDPEGNPTHLSEQLLGICAGESRDITLKRPLRESESGEQAQEELPLRVAVKEVHERMLPAIDDELAKDVGDFENLEALKTRIRSELQDQYDAAARRRAEENLVSALIEMNAFEIPESMIENYLDGVVETYKRQHAGHDHPIDEEAIRREGGDQAVRGVKRLLLLDAVAEQEKIEVQESEVERRLESLSASYGTSAQQLRQIFNRSGQLEQIAHDIKLEKIFDFLIEQADIEPEVPESEPAGAPPAG